MSNLTSTIMQFSVCQYAFHVRHVHKQKIDSRKNCESLLKKMNEREVFKMAAVGKIVRT